MPRKRFKTEEIIQKLRKAEVLLSQGRNVSEAYRQVGVTDNTYYRWRKEYGGIRSDQAKRLKELERENARLLHDLRRTLASHMAINGTSEAIIAKMLGHSSQSVTGIYARLNTEAVRDAMESAQDAMF